MWMCVWLSVSMLAVFLGGKHYWETDFCIQHVYTKDMQTHAHTFLSSLYQQLHSFSMLSSISVLLFQANVTVTFQLLVRNSSLAHWKENSSIHITHSQDIWHHQPIIFHQTSRKWSAYIPVLVPSRSGLQLRNARTKQFLHYILLLII